MCSFVDKENGLLKIKLKYELDYAYLIRLSDVTKPTKWPLPLQSICKYSKNYMNAQGEPQ